MDYWHAGLAMSSNSALPQDRSLVADHVYSLLMDTFVDNGTKFVQYATSLDHPTRLRGKGLAQARDVTQLGNDHRVVAYGWRQDSRYTYC